MLFRGYKKIKRKRIKGGIKAKESYLKVEVSDDLIRWIEED